MAMENLFVCPAWESTCEWQVESPVFDLDNEKDLKILNPYRDFPWSIFPPFFPSLEHPLETSPSSSSDEEVESLPLIEPKKEKEMEKFPEDKVKDFKHVIYNLLVDYYNDPHGNGPNIGLVRSYECEDEYGNLRTGFFFDEKFLPEKRLPELYAWHIRKSKLQDQDQECVLIQDLYKFYMRACVELLSKYFEKVDKYTFLDDDPQCPLFVPGGSLAAAEQRIKNMRTRARKTKKGKRGVKRVKLEGGIAKVAKPRRRSRKSDC